MRNRDWLFKAFRFALGVLPLVAAGCLPSLNDPDFGPLTGNFVVSDIFSPSGFMGDGAKPGYLTVDFKEEHCKQPRPPGAQGRCYTFTYFMDPTQTMMWAGAYWVFPTNSWGTRPGYAFDATKFQQVRFYAALEMPTPITKANGGNTFFNSIAGGIRNNGQYGPTCPSINDNFVRVNDTGQADPNGTKIAPCEHDDAFRAEEDFKIGTDIGSDWKQFHVGLTMPIQNAIVTNGKPPDELIGAFAWSMDFPSDSCTCSVAVSSPLDCTAQMGVLNCPTPVKIHIDDIVWDTAPPPTP